MIKLYINCVKNALKNKILLLFVLLSISAAILCVNITLASAQNEYENTLNINYLSTIAISFEDKTAQKEDLYKTINSLFPANLRNVLYITKTSDNSTLIGWQGYNTSNWFPHTNGRFFSFDEVENNEKVVYITYDEYGKLVTSENSNKKINIDGEIYDIVGAGWLTPFNFKNSISDESTQQIFVSDSSKDYSFRILPYTTFFKNYFPELVLIQFDNLTYSQLKEKMNILENSFSDAIITMPKENSDQLLFSEKAVRALIGILLSLLIYISIVGIMQEWLKINSKRYYVFVLCGARQIKIVFLILLEWLTYVIIALFLSLGIQFCLLPMLSTIGAGYMPTYIEVFAQLIVFYFFTISLSFKKIKKITTINNRGGVL